MQSKRKRAAGHHEDTAAELLQAYHDERQVSRDGNHTLLRWLVMARTYEPLSSVPPCPMDSANATPFVPTIDALEEMEQAVATRIMASEQPKGYLEYAAHFFKWWAKIAEMTATTPMPVCTASCPWLSANNLERSLVVPDVRRGAITIAQSLYVRAGEIQVASDHLGGTRSCSATLQGLRTGEWNTSMHQTLMYGTLTDIYCRKFLDPVYFSIINGRYLGRLAFEWLDMVLVVPCAKPSAPRAWPLIYAHGDHYVVHWKDTHAVCTTALLAYIKWSDICIELGGVIGGRYDVRKCTI